jgi:hypothetical protein
MSGGAKIWISQGSDWISTAALVPLYGLLSIRFQVFENFLDDASCIFTINHSSFKIVPLFI